MHVVDLLFVNRSDLLTRMKEEDMDYKSMLPCYYVEKIDEVKDVLSNHAKDLKLSMQIL